MPCRAVCSGPRYQSKPKAYPSSTHRSPPRPSGAPAAVAVPAAASAASFAASACENQRRYAALKGYQARHTHGTTSPRGVSNIQWGGTRHEPVVTEEGVQRFIRGYFCIYAVRITRRQRPRHIVPLAANALQLTHMHEVRATNTEPTGVSAHGLTARGDSRRSRSKSIVVPRRPQRPSRFARTDRHHGLPYVVYQGF